MADELPPESSQNGLDTDAPRVQVIGQYIKDLSFENPGVIGGQNARPQIELNVDLQARQVEREHFEVELKLRVNAKSEDRALFLLELVYGGLFEILGVPESDIEAVLLVECPRFLFPYARRIISDLTTDGGFPPFMLEPIDFAAVYASQRSGQGASVN